jgi:hypothetical protein
MYGTWDEGSAGSSGARGPDGARASGRLRLAVEGDRVDLVVVSVHRPATGISRGWVLCVLTNQRLLIGYRAQNNQSAVVDLSLAGDEPTATLDDIEPRGKHVIRRTGRQEWAAEWGDDEHVTPGVRTADLDRLAVAVAPVRKYVHMHVADAEAKAVEATDLPTLGDARAAIDVIGQLFQRYYALLGGGFVKLTPEIQHDWIADFREPWIKPGFTR